MKSSALSYLLITKIKNNLKSLVKKPIRLILLILFLGFMSFTFFASNMNGTAGNGYSDMAGLTAIINAVLILMFATTFYSGIQSGGTMFRMADVNILFPSPVNKRNILLYALVQQMGTSLFIGVFLLFQYFNLHNIFGISMLDMFVILLAYTMTIFLSQCFAMFLYTFISDDDRKKTIVKTIFFSALGLLLVYVGIGVLRDTDNIMSTLTAYGNSLPVIIFPVGGWLGAISSGVLTGNYLMAGIFLAITAVVFFVILHIVSNSKKEYYEDVIASAETIQSSLNAAALGTAPEMSPRHIKVKKSGIGKGIGSSVIFYKHLLENKRSSNFILTPLSLIFAIMSIAFAFFFKELGILFVFGMGAYFQIIATTGSRYARELTKPFVYLIPEPPFKKLIYTLMETLPNALLEAVLIYIPVTIIMGATPLEGLLCIIARLSFTAIFVAGNILIERIWGGSLSKVSGVFLYFLIDIILLIPGIALAIILSVVLNVFADVGTMTTTATSLLALTVCNVPIAGLSLYFCRNMMQYAETT